MRYRFFFIILATLLLGAAGINFIEFHFFQQQRLGLIDQQIDRSMKLLLASKDFRHAADKLDDVEDAITRTLSSERIGKVFIVRDERGKVLHQGMNMALLQTDLPTSPEWVTIRAKDQYVRLLNSKLSPTRSLQVGLVLDENFVNWSIVNRDTVAFMGILVLVLFSIAVMLTIVLLSPIRLLSAHLLRATADLSNLKDVDPLPATLTEYAKGFWARSDEFASLVGTVEKLIARINRNYEMTRTWTLQMAHELKTPLAIARAATDAARAEKKVPEDVSANLLGEIDSMSGLVTQFLTWAELENTRPQKSIHVLNVAALVKTVATRLETLCQRRIAIEVVNDFAVAAAPGHLEQLITNLLHNACKFAPEGTDVAVTVGDRQLVVQDRGPGIPPEVLTRLGQPFNVGSSSASRNMKGSGLGLAWISTVSKIYDWKLAFEVSDSGTRIEVEFPQVE